MSTESQRASAWREAVRRGDQETSQVLTKVFSVLREEGTSKAAIAQALSIRTEEIDELVFGLALTALTSTDKGATAPRSRPDLRVVA